MADAEKAAPSIPPYIAIARHSAFGADRESGKRIVGDKHVEVIQLGRIPRIKAAQ